MYVLLFLFLKPALFPSTPPEWSVRTAMQRHSTRGIDGAVGL